MGFMTISNLEVNDKKKIHKKMSIDFFVILLVLFCALLGATGQIMFKLASSGFSFNPSSWFSNIYFLIGAFLYGASAILFVWSLKHGNLSILYPVIATSYIWVTLMATSFLGESFPRVKWIGIILIVLGVTIIAQN